MPRGGAGVGETGLVSAIDAGSEFDTGRRSRHAAASRASTTPRWVTGWRIGGGVNGGVLLAIAGRALAAELGTADGDRPAHPDPLAISAYYLTPGVAGAGHGAHLGRPPRARGVHGPGLAAAGRRRRRRGRAGPVPRDLRRPRLGRRATSPPRRRRRSCRRRTSACPPRRRRRTSSSTRRCSSGSTCGSTRPRPAGPSGKPSGNGVIRGWLRMADGREPDPLLLLLAVDALPPVAFELGLPGLDADARADGARARPPGPGLAAGQPHQPHPGRRLPRGGRRGLGQRGPARRPVATARSRSQPHPPTAGRLSALWLSLSESSACPTSASPRCSTP